MISKGLLQLALVMFLTFLGYCRGQGQTLLLSQNLSPSSDSSDKIQSNPITFPPTPVYSTRVTTTLPVAQSPFPYVLSPSPTIPAANGPDQKPTTIIPTGSSSSFMRPFTPSRVTAQRSAPSTTPLTTLPTVSPQQTTLLQVFIAQSTALPQGVTAPPSTPQHVQIGFNNKYADLAVNEYDTWGNRQSAQRQLGSACSVSLDRITDVSIQSNATGYLVVRFTILQGYPIYISEAVESLKTSLQSPQFMTLSGKPLNPSGVIFWTDDGPCPEDQCINGGVCNVDVSGSYGCQCSPGYAGARCQDAVSPSGGRSNPALFALLVLLVIPIAIALAVGFYFGLRRQQKMQLKRAFDLRDVRTIGPKSMLSLPHEPGMRNEMYDTRSFALAFTDTSFSKSSSQPTSEDDLMSHMG